MRKLFIFLLITAELLSCKHEDHLKWPKAKGIIVGDGSNGRYSSFLGADSREYLGV